MHKCPYCGKPIYHPGYVFTSAFASTSMWCTCNATTVTIRFVAGNATNPLVSNVQCPMCKWYVHPALHTETECERLRGYNRVLDPQKVEVPKAFQEAFEGQELEL